MRTTLFIFLVCVLNLSSCDYELAPTYEVKLHNSDGTTTRTFYTKFQPRVITEHGNTLLDYQDRNTGTHYRIPLEGHPVEINKVE